MFSDDESDMGVLPSHDDRVRGIWLRGVGWPLVRAWYSFPRLICSCHPGCARRTSVFKLMLFWSFRWWVPFLCRALFHLYCDGYIFRD